MNFKIRECELANKEHRKSKRQYAHVFHNIGTICIASAMRKLPASHYYGIIAHEIGHLMTRGDEKEANAYMLETFGIKIRYKNSAHGDRLEYLTKKDIGKLLKYYDIE